MLALLRRLAARTYRFVTISPASHARVLARKPGALAADLRDVLGWSLPFRPGSVDVEVEALLQEAGCLRREGELARATVRVSSIGEQLFLHSAYPTDSPDAVFFGPDSYRFAAAARDELAENPLLGGVHIVDVGAGAGVGGIVTALAEPSARVTLTDVNPLALRYARINAAAAGVEVETIEGDSLADVADPIDLAIANPPYIIDDLGRAYRDGGDLHGGAVSLEMARMAVARLAPGGRLLLYTGAAIIEGDNPLARALEELAAQQGLVFACRETDPDVFGEELENPAYRDADRLAVILATFQRR